MKATSQPHLAAEVGAAHFQSLGDLEYLPPDPAPPTQPDPTDPAPGPQEPELPVIDPPHEPSLPEPRMGISASASAERHC
jgi:hypothetical protein